MNVKLFPFRCRWHHTKVYGTVDHQALSSADLVCDCGGHTTSIPTADNTVQNTESHLRVPAEHAVEASDLRYIISAGRVFMSSDLHIFSSL